VSCGRESKLFCKALVGGSALRGFANVLAVRWQNQIKTSCALAIFFQSTELSKSIIDSVCTVIVNGANVPFLFFLFQSPD